MKDKVAKFKEAWKEPKKRAGIKLLIYIIFFILLLVSAGITSRVKINNKDTITTINTTTTAQTDKYSDKKLDLLTNKYNVNYTIKENNTEYKINGTLNNNVVIGYLETNDDIKKIIIKNTNLYEIINEQELELNIFNKDFITISYIINLIKDKPAIISNNNDIKTYTYDVEDKTKIIISSNETIITEINIEQDTSSYVLNFDK